MHDPKYHIINKIYHVEILPPKQESTKLISDLDMFKEKYLRVMDSGYCACITDNAMGLMAFQGHEIIEEMNLPVHPDQVMIHLNTFHTKADLDNILKSCVHLGIESLLIISGDGSDRLPKLQPSDIDESEVESVTSVELLRYIRKTYPDTFVLGVAFNPYEPPEHEFAKMKRKIEAGATFIITQPIIEQNAQVDRLLTEYPDIPVTVEAWMSKKLSLLSDAIGYEIPADMEYDPIATLKMLHQIYPKCGVYLSLVGFKTQYDLVKDVWK
jgi:methylenetetrahydrofolate reductase (NADPH)